jgi:hypothetical protein
VDHLNSEFALAVTSEVTKGYILDKEFDNFDLLIEQGSNGYRASVINARFGMAKEATEFTLPFSQEQLSTLFWLSGQSRHMGIADESAESAERLTPLIFGKELFQAVFKGDLRLNLALSYQSARQRDAGLRLRLWFGADVAELADLPWEFLWAPDPFHNDFLALREDTPIIRCPLVDRISQSFSVTPPLRILVVLANPTDAEPLKVNEEFQRLQQALEKLQAAGAVDLQQLEVATLDALNQRLRADDFHVLHFIGHGFFNEATNQGGLVFEDNQGKAHLVSADVLWNELRREESLRLIFLNACEGARSGSSDFFAGVAQQLVQKGIAAVLAMQFPITDKAAITLAHEFYDDLAEGRPLDTALVAARSAVRRTGNELEWATPVLFSRQEDLRLLGQLGAGGGPTYNGPTHPRTRDELQSLELRIPDRVVVRKILFSPRSLTIGERVTVEEPIYAQGDIHIGKNSYLKSHLFAGGSVYVGDGVVIDGDLLIRGKEVILGNGCIVRGSVRATGSAKTGSRCLLTGLQADQVELGGRCKVGHLQASANASLEEGVTVGRCHVAQRLTLRRSTGLGIEILENTLFAGSIEWPETARLRMGGVSLSRSNLFVYQNGALLPGPMNSDVVDQPVMVTTLLNYELVTAITETTPVKPGPPAAAFKLP